MTALRSTGRPDNAIVLERGTASELTSTVTLEHRNAILDDLRIARGPDGQAVASWESLTVVALPRRVDGRRTSVTLRAVTPRAYDVRGGIHVTAGRRFRPGLEEVIVGRRILERVRGLGLGGTLVYDRKRFDIVGVFASDGAAFESEIWGDYDTLAMPRLDAGSNALVVRMKEPNEIPELDRWLRSRPNMRLQVLAETRYYENQAGHLTTSIRAIAAFLAFGMGVGAVFGAMNTMYALVATRTREIGTLRALGFSRRAILLALVLESALLALLGGGLGCALAFSMHGYSTGATNIQSMSEIAYAFRISPEVVLGSLGFAVAMGVAGGLLPALRAARLPIAAAVRGV